MIHRPHRDAEALIARLGRFTRGGARVSVSAEAKEE